MGANKPTPLKLNSIDDDKSTQLNLDIVLQKHYFLVVGFLTLIWVSWDSE